MATTGTLKNYISDDEKPLRSSMGLWKSPLFIMEDATGSSVDIDIIVDFIPFLLKLHYFSAILI
jgi:hypothetical protein